MAGVHEVTLPVRLTTTAVVGPGEKLIVARTDRISMADAERLKARIAELLPGVDVVIISECSGLGIYRDDSQVLTYSDCEHPPLQAIRAAILARLDESDEAISAAWLRKLLA